MQSARQVQLPEQEINNTVRLYASQGWSRVLQHNLCHSKMCKQNPRRLTVQPFSLTFWDRTLKLAKPLSTREKRFVIQEIGNCQLFPANAASRMLTRACCYSKLSQASEFVLPLSLIFIAPPISNPWPEEIGYIGQNTINFQPNGTRIT